MVLERGTALRLLLFTAGMHARPFQEDESNNDRRENA